MSFTIGRCQVSFSYFFFLLIAILLLFDTSGVAAAGLAATALHECSHLCFMYAFDSVPEKIRFNAFGIDIVRTSRPGPRIFKRCSGVTGRARSQSAGRRTFFRCLRFSGKKIGFGQYRFIFYLTFCL
jgi:hypothetical protein